ncbi:uncharacterized protein PV09_03497 [Verruconis gallopava]|uniref:Uncharacterized protein n=1 Tax=Verruconis gallopava TaxID=253628 RepID=A0A0D1XSA4_9PEZI|nr:uncharacterized protein PV09_03497 [Verruconis gallopava]KIW05626.1 hypothetical protein PV09_03497 [Verruconis gallopava]
MSGNEREAAPIFKKRGKATFKRKHEHDHESESETDQQISVAEILRQRKHCKVRRRASDALPAKDELQPSSIANKQQSDVDRMHGRFVPQTGQVVGMYDKQMNDYIEAKMAEFRNQKSASVAAREDSTASAAKTSTGTSHDIATQKQDKQSVAAGKLIEVDLGDSVSKYQEEEAAKALKPSKVRLGRDGKPWRPRKRRDSESLARDALVESVLKENSLSRFQDFMSSTTSTAANNEYVDEEAVLQNFKSNYQDPVRRESRRAGHSTKSDQPRGPKLGGSKNARRAMEEHAAGKKM